MKGFANFIFGGMCFGFAVGLSIFTTDSTAMILAVILGIINVLAGFFIETLEMK